MQVGDLWWTVTTVSANSKDVAKAINSLLSLLSEDHGDLLEVIEDYFSDPVNSSVHDPEEDFSNDDRIDEMEID